MSERGKIDLPMFREAMKEQQEAARRGPEGYTLVQRAKIRLIENQLKEARVGDYTILCDEAKSRRGGGQAPSPLQYFVAAIGFWMFSQLTRYASELDVPIDDAEMDIRMTYDTRGKLLLADVSPGAQAVEYTFEISSPVPADQIRELVQMIERGCHTMNTIRQPTRVVARVVHNGAALGVSDGGRGNWGASQARSSRSCAGSSRTRAARPVQFTRWFATTPASARKLLSELGTGTSRAGARDARRGKWRAVRNHFRCGAHRFAARLFVIGSRPRDQLATNAAYARIRLYGEVRYEG